jgi:hypothetical protein
MILFLVLVLGLIVFASNRIANATQSKYILNEKWNSYIFTICLVLFVVLLITGFYILVLYSWKNP